MRVRQSRFVERHRSWTGDDVRAVRSGVLHVKVYLLLTRDKDWHACSSYPESSEYPESWFGR